MVACPERELYMHVDSGTHKGDHFCVAEKDRNCSLPYRLSPVCALSQSPSQFSRSQGVRGKWETLLRTHSVGHLRPVSFPPGRQGQRHTAPPCGESEFTYPQAWYSQLPSGVTMANRSQAAKEPGKCLQGWSFSGKIHQSKNVT